MPSRPAADGTDNSLLLLGEMRGQLREVIHKMNNREQRDEQVARTLAKLEEVPDRLERIENRITTLESDKNRRDGERGVLAYLLKSPVVAWLLAIGTLVWTYIERKGQ